MEKICDGRTVPLIGREIEDSRPKKDTSPTSKEKKGIKTSPSFSNVPPKT